MVKQTQAGCDFVSLAAPGVAGLKPYNPGKPIEELEREYGIARAVKLASNENPLGPGTLALRAIWAPLGSLHRYPDGSGYALKKALAAHLSIGTGAITPDHLTLGNGSNEILELAARTFVTPADEVVFSEHAFAVYPIVTQAVGARAIVTPARSYGHDLDAMRRAVTERTRLCFIANPNNPTGTWVGSDALWGFLTSMPKHVLVLIDEAYYEYVDEPGYPNGVAWIERFPNLIVTRTFSKIHGLAGLRLGYGVSHPEVAGLFNRVRQPFNVNSLALAAAEAALEDEGHVAWSRRINQAGLRQLEGTCEALGLSYIPSVANFLCIALPRPGGDVYEGLLCEGVITRPIAGYGLPGHLRVTVGTEAENARFAAALTRVLGFRTEQR
ncbi:MAG: histidinol-phosphate transaminase [Beggiatoa sp.]|nr:histidinol-phosphate transaminase [Beggiatoa sp.]